MSKKFSFYHQLDAMDCGATCLRKQKHFHPKTSNFSQKIHFSPKKKNTPVCIKKNYYFCTGGNVCRGRMIFAPTNTNQPKSGFHIFCMHL